MAQLMNSAISLLSQPRNPLATSNSSLTSPRTFAAAMACGSSVAEERRRLPHVLTVAGSDSGAGAGIQADIKAVGAAGAYCSSVITALTAQNTVGVQGVYPVPEDFVDQQLRSVLSDMQVDVVKTGMLPSVAIIKVLCQCLREFPVQALVVDPVMVSTSGDVLSAPSVLAAYRDELLPMADIVTPNLKEASALLGGLSLKTVDDMCVAAKTIYNLGPRNVLVKGGHLPHTSDAVDILFDGEQCHKLYGSRITTRNTHGTGCSLASYIAAELAKGLPLLQAVQEAKSFVEHALRHSKDIIIGNGSQGPFDHLFRLKSHSITPRKSRFDADDLLLYAVTDAGMNKRWGRSITDAVKAAIEGGATIIQLREKEAETREFVEAATACMKICRVHGVRMLINDRVDVALACGADGVHVGQSDMPVSIARGLLGPEMIIGVSCKNTEQAEKAWEDGADYIGCGGVFPTNTKADNLTIGLQGLKSVCLSSKLPVVAIGGINAQNAQSVLQVGAPNLKGIAVVSAIFDKESVAIATKSLKSSLLDVASTVK